MASRTKSRTNCWFVSVQKPKSSPRSPGLVRQAKTFSTEAEAKLYAKEMLAKERNIIAGTLLGPDQPARRIISSSQVDRWIAENLASTNETLNDIN